METKTIARPDLILLDIEGTTTPIQFVYETLFPFVREHLDDFLRSRGGRAEIELILRALCAEPGAGTSEEDMPPVVADPSDFSAVAALVRWQMDRDRKTTALKELQGHIWRDGYERGQLCGEVFDDVPGALRSWAASGIRISIYSSGSIEAQKLLFRHTQYGDLTPLFSGHFDTRTGAKRERSSYESIAALSGVPAPSCLFVTDVLAEAEAASLAGFEVVLSCRPGNPGLAPHGFSEIVDFRQLDAHWKERSPSALGSG